MKALGYLWGESTMQKTVVPLIMRRLDHFTDQVLLAVLAGMGRPGLIMDHVCSNQLF